jgi:TolB-like protein
MNIKKLRLSRFVFLGLFCSSIIATGCSLTGGVPQWSGSGFIRKEFLEYKKVAVLPFKDDTKGEASDTFTQSFNEKFQQIALVERKQLSGTFKEQDLYPDQLSESTRRKIGEVFGVQALIIGNVYYPSILRWLLQVQIIDVETGEVMGRSLVEINYMGAEGVKEACRIAVQNLTVK